MKLTNLSIRDLITPENKLTFLVGAGCSVDAPSCLPAGRQMMDSIIKYTCAEAEIKRILELEDLRFEQLIEIIRDQLDPYLWIIDYYGECDKPNLQHFFLAEMIKKGNFVLTTNFDFLIEYAILHSGIPKEDIIPVITREDFEQFKDPLELLKQGKQAIYKIHGSTENIITGESTRESLIATIQGFGANKVGQNVFQLESFKQPAFSNLTKNRSLVVMGYSGSDDFDIVPTLKVLKQLQNVIWINHLKDGNRKAEIHEIIIDKISTPKKFDKNNEKLLDIKRMNNVDHIFWVDTNTTQMIKELLGNKPDLSLDNFSLNTMDWLKENIEEPDEFEKYYIPSKIYLDLGEYKNTLKCLEKLLHKAEKIGEQYWKASALCNIGRINTIQGNYSKALKYYEEALEIDEQQNNLEEKATDLNNIGRIYHNQSEYKKALRFYKKAFQIDVRLKDSQGKVIRVILRDKSI